MSQPANENQIDTGLSRDTIQRQAGRFARRVAKLRAASGASARAVEFAALTTTRAGAVCGAVWDEVDFGNALWSIPVADKG